jgi:hypothetical protein
MRIHLLLYFTFLEFKLLKEDLMTKSFLKNYIYIYKKYIIIFKIILFKIITKFM